MNSNIKTSAVRTFVPFLVGGIVTRLAAMGVEVSPEDAATLASFLTVAIGWVYYLVVRLIEARHPKWGWLLGIARQPNYKDGK